MAILDTDSGNIVVRIVYAGPPLSGKTESVKRLAGILLGNRVNGALTSPGEAAGRTLYFDWLDYEGGLYKGKKVKCQIITVPGQAVFTQRRKAILETADAVVFVTGSTSEDIPASVQAFNEMQPWLEQPEDYPAVGILVQANKRDMPDCIDIETIRENLGNSENTMVTQSVATEGKAIRETFVMSVGLALERVHALAEQGALEIGKPEIASGEDLLAALLEHEPAAPQTEPQHDLNGTLEKHLKPGENRWLIDTLAQNKVDITLNSTNNDGRPILPNRNVEAGRVWPAIAGRIILNEISTQKAQLQTHENNDWSAQINHQWQLYNNAEDVYPSESEGLAKLMQYARWHQQYRNFVSPRRCYALVKDNEQSYRIWQVMRSDNTLEEKLKSAFDNPDHFHVADQLADITNALVETSETIYASGYNLPVSLKSVAIHQTKPVYLGRIPADLTEETLAALESDAQTSLIREQMQSTILTVLEKEDIDVATIVRGLESRRQDGSTRADLIEVLIAMLIGH
jgi:signal recognition particle receptor subunit beta